MLLLQMTKEEMAAEDAVGRHGIINVTVESDVVRYPELEQFFYWYRPYHGYVAVAVCVLGIVANSANMVVLTRPSMRSPINYILSGLALSDWLTMLAYVPFALIFYILYGVEMSVQRNTWSAAQFLLFYARFSVVVHIAAIWLTVVLAMFRYIIIRSVTCMVQAELKLHYTDERTRQTRQTDTET